MRFVLFDDHRLGVVKGESVVDVSSTIGDAPGSDPRDNMRRLIERFADHRERIRVAVAEAPGRPVASVRLRSPLPRPQHIICIRVNYRELQPIFAGSTMAPDGDRTAPMPLDAFLKATGSVIGHEDTMVLPDVGATVFEGEAELGVVIGRYAADVSPADAMAYVFGYTGFIDGSARGLPPHYQMKSRATFAPIGPSIVTADEIADPYDLQVRLWNNGVLMQDFSTRHMAHDIAHCIAFASSVCPLEPGDIIATGTDHGGLHAFQHGDVVELRIGDLELLRIHVRDDLKRTWERETRSQRYARGLRGTAPQLTGKYAPADASS